MDDETLKRRLNLELENLSFNQLTELGNEAVNLGLIAGHGYHNGQYEIIQQGKIVTLAPREAFQYLQQLVRSVNG